MDESIRACGTIGAVESEVGTTLALWSSRGRCRLCGADGPLCRSHIIPKFVGDWLRSTNLTGRLRTTAAPNKVVEDLPWRHMLCQSCEAKFSRFEGEVCEGIFLPLHESRQRRFRYGPAFTRFAVSVVWRSLVVLMVEDRLGKLAAVPRSATAAERRWREYLLELQQTPAPYDVHALPLDVPDHVPGGADVSPHLSRSLLRGVSQGTQSDNGTGTVMVKMARLMIFGIVAYGHERRLWKETKLHLSGGAWGGERFRLPGWVEWYLKLGASTLQQSVEALSERQQDRNYQKLLEHVRRDPDAVAASGVFEAFDRDVELFGDAVFQDEPRGKTE